MELAPAADGEAEAALAAGELHREVLVVLRQVGVHLLVLLQGHGEEGEGERGQAAGRFSGRAKGVAPCNDMFCLLDSATN